MIDPRSIRICAVVTALGMASVARAQPVAEKWSVEFAVGWDNSISGNINSSAVGTLNNQTVVILKNKYEDVYRYRASPAFWRRVQAE